MQTPDLINNWQSLAAEDLTSCHSALRDCLLEPGSLTRRLEQCFVSAIDLSVENEDWQTALEDEATLLSIAQDEKCFVREIRLHSKNHPRVFARSVIPEPAYRAKEAAFSGLGEKPLANMLFSDPEIYRQQLEIARIHQQSMLAQSSQILQTAFQSLPDAENRLWARRSVFLVAAHPFLVTEVFLPDFLQGIA